MAAGYGIHKGINHIYKKGYDRGREGKDSFGFIGDMIDDEYNYRYYKKMREQREQQ